MFSQPHSSLNRFADQQDRKTELFLCLLSWIDFLKPKFVYFENVAGFTTSRLPFGGNKDFDYSKIDSGILKLFVHALLSLGYAYLSFLTLVPALISVID